MSQENVEILRRLYEHWATGDFPGDFFDPDVEHSRIGAQTPDMEGRWLGLDEFLTAFRGYLQALSDLRIEAERIIDLSGDRVLVLSRQTARGKQSGVPIEHEPETCSHCATARSCATPATGTGPTPSKPPGFRSRRCRRGTSNSYGDSPKHSTPMISTGTRDFSMRGRMADGEGRPRRCNLSRAAGVQALPRAVDRELDGLHPMSRNTSTPATTAS